MKYFWRILALTTLVIFATALIKFYVQWERVGEIIEISDLPSQLESFGQNDLSDTEALIGDIVFESSEETDRSFCPSFKRLRTRKLQVVGPSNHLAKLLLLNQKPNKSLGFQIDSLFLACRLERDYSQDFLLRYTLSKVYLGNGEYGVRKVSVSLFEMRIEQLSDAEIFRIAALIQSPSLRNNEEAWKRRTLALIEKSSPPD